MGAAGAAWRRGRNDGESGPGPGTGVASGPMTASAAASAGGRSGAVCRFLRRRGRPFARGGGRSASGSSCQWNSAELDARTGPGSGAASVSKHSADPDPIESAGSEHRLGGGQLGEGGGRSGASAHCLRGRCVWGHILCPEPIEPQNVVDRKALGHRFSRAFWTALQQASNWSACSPRRPSDVEQEVHHVAVPDQVVATLQAAPAPVPHGGIAARRH